MGAHVWAPDFLRHHLLPKGRITGWAPDWWNGFPAFVFYFPLPSLLIALLSFAIPYGIAFKLVSVLGVISLPIAAYAFGRLSGLRFPGPPILAVATLPFLFDTSFAIYGGNIASTLAGEFSFSIALSLALVFLGVLARGLETGRHRALAAVLLALTALCHLVPALFASIAAAALFLMRPDRRRFRYVAVTGVVAAALTAFWALPFLVRLPYGNDLGWVKITTYSKALFPEHIWWVFVPAVAGAIAAVGLRLRAALTMLSVAAVSGAAFVMMPEGRLWNARLLPFWFLCLYLLAGIGVAEVGRAVGGMFSRDPEHPAVWPSLVTPLVALAAALVLVGGPLQALPGWLPVRPGTQSFVPSWARWNYSGYERKPAYPEYRALMDTMGRLPCGRAMWEYERGLDRYGTPMALMLLPYWTRGCIGSQEGLYFEATTSVPFHFLNQSELSKSPSRPQRDLPYSNLDVSRGIEHLKLLGVRYYLAFSPEVLAQAHSNPDLRLVATSRPWEIFEIAGSELVAPLAREPAVLTGVKGGKEGWLAAALPLYESADPAGAFLAADGPRDWVRVRPGETVSLRATPAAHVSGIRSGDDWISFNVDEVGVPILVKASYFPNWKAQGARGPWRVTPNLMVVVPTARHVRLHYGYTPVDIAGWALTLLGVLALAVVLRRPVVFAKDGDTDGGGIAQLGRATWKRVVGRRAR